MRAALLKATLRTSLNNPLNPLGFAHRGARALERDNTIPSFRRALALGAAGLESDVWVTADGVPVLDHDGYIVSKRRNVKIADVPLSVLPPHIPRLADLYSCCGTGFSLSLDVKDPLAARAVCDVTRAVGGVDMLSRLWLCNPDWRIVATWRDFAPESLLVDSTRIRKIEEGFDARIKKLAAAGLDAINMRHGDWEPMMIEATHVQGLRAMAWDLQRPSDLNRLLEMGIDAVFSDHVDRMLAAIDLNLRR